MKNENAFTLVELLATTSIVGILASLSIANMTEFRSTAMGAQRTAAISMLRTAFAARDEGGKDLTGDNQRQIGKNYNGTFYASVNGGTRENLMAGVPEKPEYFHYYTVERNSNTASATANIQRHVIYDCRDGTFHQWYLKNDGRIIENQTSYSFIDNAC